MILKYFIVSGVPPNKNIQKYLVTNANRDITIVSNDEKIIQILHFYYINYKYTVILMIFFDKFSFPAPIAYDKVEFVTITLASLNIQKNIVIDYKVTYAAKISSLFNNPTSTVINSPANHFK